MKNLVQNWQVKGFYKIWSRCFCSKENADVPKAAAPAAASPKEAKRISRAHAARLNTFFRSKPHLFDVIKSIPEKYFSLKRITPPENLYLIDKEIAKKAVSYVLPRIKNNDNQIVAESNVGLGLISKELLENGVKLIRLYEPCSEFRESLQKLGEAYKGRIEIFTKDIFLLSRYDYMDKQDHGCRVAQLIRGLPRKSWVDDPVMTVIGSMFDKNFVRFLTRSLILQTNVTAFGRFELFVFMKPKDYVILTAGPHLNLHTYQIWSVIFNLFFESELLEKFPRNVFLPWESEKVKKMYRYPQRIDQNQMYFVRICLKKDLPVTMENLLPLYSFVMQFFGKGNNRVVPMLEKWVPGSGLDAMVPKAEYDNYFSNLDIFTKFGELTPTQILYVFKEMMSHPEYSKSPFMAMVESQLIKTETIESSLDEHLEKSITQDIEAKLN